MAAAPLKRPSLHHQHEAMHLEHEGMSGPEHEAMLAEQQKRFLWTYYTNILLGVWLMASPVTLGSMERALAWSDLLSGLLVIPLAVLAMFRQAWAAWTLCFVGIWLLFAPLVFWTTSSAAYLNDTVVGSLLIAFSVLIPGMPGMGWMEMPGPEIPPGWTYNPSSWIQRGPIIGLAFIGFFISRYLAAYQLGHIPAAWDPFFGESTQKVLTSDVSKAWPISDAGLGALSYMLEALSGYMGDSRRWRTMPWMVLMFTLLVVPLGATSIILVILQPVSIGMWCTLCLIAAATMLLMVPLAVDEVIAMGQFMKQSRREGKPFWQTFWKGGNIEGGGPDTRSPHFSAPASAWAPAMVWGVTLPWSLVVSAALGVWLMVAPSALETEAAIADSDHLVGALIVTFSVIAWAEVTRGLRWLNAALGLWLIAAPWFLTGGTSMSTGNDVAVGLLLLLTSLPRGTVHEYYATWNRYIS
ncbi:MAG: vitamin K epoxide reductase family protein [Nitrospira sp.]|nr:vitamin K epoxide reductase family protein [Nitrospira sp.]